VATAPLAPYGLLDYYSTSVLTGLKTLAGPYWREAAARIVNPLSYPRYLEFQLTVNRLPIADGGRLLDIGSPKLPVLLVTRHTRCQIHTTDIRDYFIPATSEFLRRNGQGQRLGRDIHLEVQDARRLTYDDAFFDWIYSVSVIEHIPDGGDAVAMSEIRRVLRPGGVVALTVPFSDAGYREEWVRGDVYEREGQGAPNFYQRHYDLPSLRARLIEPSGMEVVETTFFGEPGVRFEPTWNRIPMRWKVPALWAQPLLAKAFLRPLRPHERHAAVGVAVTLRKR
jgi:SAM-dependent methyltransferase